MDEFKTVTFRIDAGTRSAVCDFSDTLHYGDSLKLVFEGVKGIDADNAVAGIFEPVAGASVFLNDGGDTAGDFDFVSGRTDAVYATVSLTTAGLKALTEAAVPGTPVTLRLYLSDGVKTWVDTEIAVYPEPLLSGTAPTATTGLVFVTTKALHDAIDPVLSMPTLTAAEREARFNALLAALGGLYTP